MSRTESTVPKRLFTAINGQELAEIIAKDLQAQMANDMDFAESQTFPIVEYVAAIKIKAYPWRTDKAIEKEVALRLEQFDENGNLLPVGEPMIIESEVSDTIDAQNPPDKAREDHGLPVPMPGKSDTGSRYYVDKPTKRNLLGRHRVEPGK